MALGRPSSLRIVGRKHWLAGCAASLALVLFMVTTTSFYKSINSMVARGDDTSMDGEPSRQPLATQTRSPAHQVSDVIAPSAAVARPSSSTSWNVQYLPSSISGMVDYYHATNLQPQSLRMMLAPVAYADMQCDALMIRHEEEYRDAVSRIDFTRPPKYKMPWYFHDPFALCGRYMLTHLTDGKPHFVHRLVVNHPAKVPPSPAAAIENQQLPLAYVTADPTKVYGDVVHIEHCGMCRSAPSQTGRNDDAEVNRNDGVWSCNEDILLQARLISENRVISADVTEDATSPNRLRVAFRITEPGVYVLEVKVVHLHGGSSNASNPKSLGVIGIRASDHNKKSFKYNLACDMQRHIYGSPMQIVAVPPAVVTTASNVKPLCTLHTLNQSIGAGEWVRVPSGSTCDSYHQGAYCVGDPTWLTDACGFNKELVWVPDSCRMRVYSPPKGPEKSCLRRGRSGFLLLVGDSVTREYVQNCRLFDFRNARLHCLFANIALEGQHYSLDYAKAVVKAMMEALTSNRPGVFATNLGIHHMIGKSSTEQWMEFIDLFVAAWKSARIEILDVGTDKWLLEKAVWLGPPTIHYARHGMGYQRALLWDTIAWSKLSPLGFRRLYAVAPTLSRTEATWDGLHYASAKGKVQSPWRNRAAPVLLWNGGVANMLFNMLLNLICDDV